MKKVILALVVATMCGMGVSCSKAEEEVPQKILDLYPTAASIEQEGSLITSLDKKGNVVGYVLNSKPASDGIEGKNGETPLEILIDGDKVVTNVEMLENQETPSFVNIVVKSGLLEKWNGVGVEEAVTKPVDVVSGATLTSNSVIKTFRTAVKANKANM